METLWQQWLILKEGLFSGRWAQSWQWQTLDFGLILVLAYVVLVMIGERRSLWMVRGFIWLMLTTAIARIIHLERFALVLTLVLLISAVAMAIELHSELRRFLEQVGQFRLSALFQPELCLDPKTNDMVEEIVDAVKELSQSRTGALMILETAAPIDDRDFRVPGVRLNAELSRELLQTIFQTSTLLHDGAVLIRASRIVAASVILPISERPAARRLGTRHRAAMGITERVKACVCVVVSEETGSISLAEEGTLKRPITSSKLKELLEERFSPAVDRGAVAPDLRNLSHQAWKQVGTLMARLLHFLLPSTLREKK
ncbi:diadenylate cyclase CdaA [Prochlorothrix hollandica]|uniref:diadenylate cyclase CdaA n=1 Tax=Prochlorothrix hollandica TaxID=1223 RepID=UPI000349534E|nr:diadenylate cyclase CdaA [Prochlorothrix hollandica]